MAVERPRLRQSVPTKELILDTAARILAERGYEATNLELVAQEAGVTKATVYYHFESKAAILTEVLHRYFVNALAQVQQMVERGGSALDVTASVIDHLIDDTFDPSRRYVMYQELLSVNPETREAMRTTQRQYENEVAEIIRRGQDAGEFVDGDPMVLTFVIIGAVARTARWYHPDGRVPTEEFRKTLAGLLLRGLSRIPMELE